MAARQLEKPSSRQEEKKEQGEPTNPNALRLPLSRASVNESRQRLWHKLLSMSLVHVNDSCQRQESATC